MRDRDNSIEAKCCNHGLEIGHLLRKAIAVAGFVRGAESEKVESNDAAAGGRQIRDQFVIDVQIIGKAVHRHEGRSLAWVVAHIKRAVLDGDAVFNEILRVHDDIPIS